MKFTLGLLVGAVAGAAVVHYLNTPEGKGMVDKAKKAAAEIGDNVATLLGDLLQGGKSFAEQDFPAQNRPADRPTTSEAKLSYNNIN
jgi:hypothetical protein